MQQQTALIYGGQPATVWLVNVLEAETVFMQWAVWAKQQNISKWTYCISSLVRLMMFVFLVRLLAWSVVIV